MDWLSPLSQVVGSTSFFLKCLSIIRAVLGFILVFFLPGFAWTLVFFSGRQLNVVERIALSFGLSIAVVTLSVLLMNTLLGVRITTLNSLLIIIVVTIVPVAFYYLSQLVRGRLSREGRKS